MLLVSLIILFKTPYPKYLKIGLHFSYYFLFEYGMIARNYGIEILLLFALIYLVTSNKKSFFLIGITVFFLFQTHIFSMIIGIPILAIYGIKLFKNKDEKIDKRALILLCFSIIISIIASLKAMQGSEDNYHTSLRRDAFSFEKLVYSSLHLVSSIHTIPRQFNVQFWNTHLEIKNYKLIVFLILTLLIFRFKSNLPPLIGIISTYMMFILFFTIKYEGSLRHHGHLFITLLLYYWLILHHEGSRPDANVSIRKIFNLFIIFAITCQIYVGLFAWYVDIKNVFSNSLNAANFIKNKYENDALVIVSNDYNASMFSSYLNQKVYFPNIEEWGSYTKFSTKLKMKNEFQLDSICKNALDTSSAKILLVHNVTLQNDSLRLQQIQTFSNAIVGSENFYIYEKNKK